MANFNTHLTGGFAASAVLSITCYKAGLLDNEQLILMTLTGTIGGLLPDIDSSVSKPVTLGFNLVSLMFAFLFVMFLSERLALLYLFFAWIVAFTIIRYAILETFTHLTKHRGVVHSIPYMAILSLLFVYLNFYVFKTNLNNSWMYGLFLFSGSMVHLILDEMYSVDLLDMRIKRSFGTALKIYTHKSKNSFIMVYTVLAILIYFAPPIVDFWLKISDMSIWNNLGQSLI